MLPDVDPAEVDSMHEVDFENVLETEGPVHGHENLVGDSEKVVGDGGERETDVRETDDSPERSILERL